MFGFTDFSLVENLSLAFSFIYRSAFIWLPIVTAFGVLKMWVGYRRVVYWKSLGHVLLEIRIPKVIDKSPEAMEVVISAFAQGAGESTWINRAWEGKTRDWFSLEIASIGGRVSFYIWARPKHKKLIEAQLYSQFPGVEIHEVPDYTLPYAYDPAKNSVWCCEWKLTKPDPFPLKTYVDYKLDSSLIEEERKVDPITPVLEFMGSINEGQALWLQVIIRLHKKRRFLDVFGEKNDTWKDDGAAEIKKLQEKQKGTADKPGGPLTEGERETMKALERSLGKTPFDAGIRSIYIADKDKFDGSNIGGMLGTFRQFGSPNLNSLAPTGGMLGYDYPWQDFTGRRREVVKRQMIEGYKARQYFFPPYKGKNQYILNSEELATLFHFPGAVAITPTLERIPSKKSEAPGNLPI